ncbi:MAG: hypothetical protein NTY23_01165, partial [Chloroflexi bacterium]|nr:hypothetical protein [Chloroflexota bacterium]
MKTAWVLRTNDDPQSAVVRLLENLWQRAGVETMLAPTRAEDPAGVEPTWLTSREGLKRADLFAPAMKRNAAAALAERPGRGSRWSGALLRPCEARAVN